MWEWLMSLFGGESGGAGGGGASSISSSGGGGSWTDIFKDSGSGGGGGQGSHFGSGLDQTGAASQAGQSSQASLGSILTPVQQSGFDISADNSGTSALNSLLKMLSGKSATSSAQQGEDVREKLLGDLYGVNVLNRMR